MYLARLGRAGAGLLLLLTGLVASLAVGVAPALAETPTWSQLSPGTSPPVESPSMAYDSSTHQLLLTGEASGDTVNETWVWNGTNWTQLSPATSPPARTGASMAYDPASSELVLFGGDGTGGVLGDTWTWNGSTWSQASPSSSPTPREGASMAYDTSSSQLVLFGGFDGTNYLDDTWTWSGGTWTQVGLTEPGNFTGRAFAAMAYDPASSQLLLFSGFGNPGADDTWSWSGSAWTQLVVSNTPGATGGGSMAFDPDLNQLVFFGGNTSPQGTSDSSDNGYFWDWNGSDFGGLTAGPSARDYAAMAYDPDSSQLVLFGGYGSTGNTLGDTWAYSAPTSCTSSSISDNFASDSSLDATCWQTATPLLAQVATAVGLNSTYGAPATDVAPTLAFNGTDMDMQGSSTAGSFTGVQSASAYSAPFVFNTSVEGIQSYGNTFLVSLVNAAGTEGFTVAGNLPQGNAPYDGVWANNEVGAAEGDSDPGNTDLIASPNDGVTYNVSMSIDSAGDGTVTVTYSGGSVTKSVGNVGTSGPFYVVLGQWQGSPSVGNGPNEAAWYSASLTTSCGTGSSFSDVFAQDNALNSACWSTSGSVLNNVANYLNGSTLVAPNLSFSDGMAMSLAGPSTGREFTGLQSTQAYSAPFAFQTTVKGTAATGDSAFVAYLVDSTGDTETLGVDGDLNPSESNYGIWGEIGDIAPEPDNGGQKLISSPSTGTTYNISLSVDASGSATITVNGVTMGPTGVGKGPFYVVLGQRNIDNPTVDGNDEATLMSASLASGCGSATSFADDFGTDSSLSSCWQNPNSYSPPDPQMLEALAQTDGSALGPPQLAFSGGAGGTGSGYLAMSGAESDNDQTGLQSTFAYSPPFALQTQVAAIASDVDPINIYLVNSDFSKVFDVEGNFSQGANQGEGGNYGLYASHATEADLAGDLLLSNPQLGTPYDITMSVDAAGNATASVNGGAPVSVGNIGTGPFFVLLGERAGEPPSATLNEGAWYSTSLTPLGGSVATTLSTSSPSVNSVESVPVAGLPTASVDGSSGSASGDAASAPLSSIPLHSIGLAASPLSSIPLHSIPLSSIALPVARATAPSRPRRRPCRAPCSRTCRSTSPPAAERSGPACTGWTGVLAGSRVRERSPRVGDARPTC